MTSQALRLSGLQLVVLFLVWVGLIHEQETPRLFLEQHRSCSKPNWRCRDARCSKKRWNSFSTRRTQMTNQITLKIPGYHVNSAFQVLLQHEEAWKGQRKVSSRSLWCVDKSWLTTRNTAGSSWTGFSSEQGERQSRKLCECAAESTCTQMLIRLKWLSCSQNCVF